MTRVNSYDVVYCVISACNLYICIIYTEGLIEDKLYHILNSFTSSGLFYHNSQDRSVSNSRVSG